MKRYGIILIIAIFQLLPLFSQNINILDPCFMEALLEAGVDSDEDELISLFEAQAVEELIFFGGCITDLSGIGFFSNLKVLDCANNQIRVLDLSALSKLEFLNISHNKLSSLELTNNPLLEILFCGGNELNALDLSACPGLTMVSVASNHLEEIDLTQNTKLKRFWCNDNLISDLDVSHCSDLDLLQCSGNLITTLDLSNNPHVSSLVCSSNQISVMDLSANTDLEYLNCSNNLLGKLDIKNNLKLRELDCSDNRLTHLNVSRSTMLGCLDCSSNPMKTLNMSNNQALDTTGCYCGYAGLLIHDMPALTQVCVWIQPFPPESLEVDAAGSPNIYYTTECTAGTIPQSPDSPKIFPIPTDHMLHIELQQENDFHLGLTSASGKHIRALSFNGRSFQWDLSDLPAGVYFLSIRSTGYCSYAKIIKY